RKASKSCPTRWSTLAGTAAGRRGRPKARPPLRGDDGSAEEGRSLHRRVPHGVAAAAGARRCRERGVVAVVVAATAAASQGDGQVGAAEPLSRSSVAGVFAA
ncbi:unnamed protein product, partial [Ectocarpus sp. 8 AP-2014]